MVKLSTWGNSQGSKWNLEGFTLQSIKCWCKFAQMQKSVICFKVVNTCSPLVHLSEIYQYVTYQRVLSLDSSLQKIISAGSHDFSRI